MTEAALVSLILAAITETPALLIAVENLVQAIRQPEASSTPISPALQAAMAAQYKALGG
jgi:hypothetical protein